MQNVLKQYGLSKTNCTVQPLGNGLINSTWLVQSGYKKFVLQKINQQVFKKPVDIAFNIRLLADYLKLHHPDYLFTASIKTINNDYE